MRLRLWGSSSRRSSSRRSGQRPRREDAKSAKATQAEQAEELEDFRKEKARRWQKSAELQPLSVEALQEQLDANVTEYVAVAGRGEWLAALRLSERSQLLTEALQDAHERSVGLNG